MNRKAVSLVSWLGILILLISLTSSSRVAAGKSASPDVELGEPGTSFAYARTIGETGVPYIVDFDHLNRPGGFFIDLIDNVYVAENRGHRVVEYSASGEPLKSFGVAGQPWHHDNFISYPEDVVTDIFARTWVSFPHTIKAFDAAGQALFTIPAENPWEAGTGDYQFNNPKTMVFDDQYRFYVADSGNHRVQVYDMIPPDGTMVYSTTIGITGEPRNDNLGFDNPGGLAFDSMDALYVVDSSNFRVQRCEYGVDWNCTTYFGTTDEAGTDFSHLGGWTTGIAINMANVYINDMNNHRVLVCPVGGVCSEFAGETGVPGSDNDHFYYPVDVAVDSTGLVYVSDSGNFRVQVFQQDGTYVRTIGETGAPYLTDNIHLNKPWGLYLYTDGSMLVNEGEGYRTVKLDNTGHALWNIGEAGVWGDDNDHFGCDWGGVVAGPAVDASGNIYVPDVCNHRIQIFDSIGTYLDTFGSYGQGDNEFDGPRDIEIDPQTGRIFIVDHWNQRVQVYSSDWTYQTTIGVTGEAGDDNLHLRYPWGLTLDSTGNVYIADSDNQRVQKCLPSGLNYSCTTFAGETGVIDNEFSHLHPLDLDVDTSGNLYVVDEWNNRVQVFDPSGRYLTTIGGIWGQNTGEMVGPAGVAVAADGTVYVSDRDNQRIQVFTPGYPGWVQANINGFGYPWKSNTSSLDEYNGYLYAGLWSAGPVYRTDDGSHWEEFTIPWPDYINTVFDSQVFDNQLYFATSGDSGGDIWRTNATTGELSLRTLHDDSGNWGFNSMAVYSDTLYALTSNDTDGSEIWKTGSGDLGDWTLVADQGFGNGVIAQDTVMEPFKGALYVGVGRPGPNGVVAELWMSDDGATFTPVFEDGLGNPNNTHVSSLAEFQGWFYIGFRNVTEGAEVWKTQDGVDWFPVLSGGIDDPSNARPYGLYVLDDTLYLTISNLNSGAEIWSTQDGADWDQIIDGGWGDSNNGYADYFDKAAAAFGDRLFIGTMNGANGAEIWRLQVFTNIFLPAVAK